MQKSVIDLDAKTDVPMRGHLCVLHLLFCTHELRFNTQEANGIKKIYCNHLFLYPISVSCPPRRTDGRPAFN